MKRFGAVLAGCLTFASQAALAQGETASPAGDQTAPSTDKKVITTSPPNWVRRPDGQDLFEVYPQMAVRARQFAGDVVIACKVAKDGNLADCTVQEETPVNRGFGSAALKLSKKFKMATMTKDGHATAGGKVMIPIHFRWPQ